MELQEIKKLKTEMESRIFCEIVDFEKTTSVTVSAIDVTEVMLGLGQKHIIKVTCEIKL